MREHVHARHRTVFRERGLLSPMGSWMMAAASFVLMVTTGMLASWGSDAEAIEQVPMQVRGILRQHAGQVDAVASAYERWAGRYVIYEGETERVDFRALAREARADHDFLAHSLSLHGIPARDAAHAASMQTTNSPFHSTDLLTAVEAAARTERMIASVAVALLRSADVPNSLHVPLSATLERSRQRLGFLEQVATVVKIAERSVMYGQWTPAEYM